jgi:hypothetical protein
MLATVALNVEGQSIAFPKLTLPHPGSCVLYVPEERCVVQHDFWFGLKAAAFVVELLLHEAGLISEDDELGSVSGIEFHHCPVDMRFCSER